MGTALSNLTISSFHKSLTLITDSPGEKLFVQSLGLKYCSVDTSLDKFKYQNFGLFALGKLFVYSSLNQPFLHFDNDIFLWKPIDSKFAQKDLVVQNFENLLDGPYKSAIKKIQNEFDFPTSYLKRINTSGITKSINAGILGGNDIDFIHYYSEKAFFIVEQNKNKIKDVDASVLNTILEQHLFYEIAQVKKKTISVIAETDKAETMWGLNLTPVLFSYIHLLGEGKRLRHLCEQVIMRMRYEFPEDFERIMMFYKRRCLPDQHDAEWLDTKKFEKRFYSLKKIYDYFEKCSIDDLLDRKFELRKDLFSYDLIDINKIAARTNIIETQKNAEQSLIGWNRLLPIFKEKISIKELSLFLLEKKAFPQLTEKELNFELLNMITKNCVYNDVLTLAD